MKGYAKKGREALITGVIIVLIAGGIYLIYAVIKIT